MDYALVGGGLQNSLLALALAARKPDATVALVEAEDRIGGNHTWCFHAADVHPDARSWLKPLEVVSWDGYEVRFPNLARTIDRPYTAITSQRLHRVVTETLGRSPGQVLLQHRAVEVGPDRVRFADGHELLARMVIDARGGSRSPGASTGYQKFLGLELQLQEAWDLERPILMDATVEQIDGYRFMYVLPFAPDRVMVEDTYFSDSPELEPEQIRSRVRAYVQQHGPAIREVVREETGVIPMPWKGSIRAPQEGPLVAGVAGGFFHPATGYSLPVAVRLAEEIAQLPQERFPAGLADMIRAHRRQVSTCHRLNSMLFRWFPPEQRWHVFERFYRLPLDTIERFYALRLQDRDRRRLLVGRPPRGMSLRYRLAKGGSG